VRFIADFIPGFTFYRYLHDVTFPDVQALNKTEVVKSEI